ncbi:protein of unknown function [Paraburkholderia dioscoreae]|uniref:Uncharacterized protein n=1 Tax=Paraburkholderia dioscoreae TaxID=2604047 RepID=A0A5Q4YVM0_9BURK|nr:protein of unknown function [Paraburkholderia dioscoreae]
MNPAFGYNGLQLRKGQLSEGKNARIQIGIDPADRFAREIDHMSLSVVEGPTSHTPGEEGLQNQRTVEAPRHQSEGTTLAADSSLPMLIRPLRRSLSCLKPLAISSLKGSMPGACAVFTVIRATVSTVFSAR